MTASDSPAFSELDAETFAEARYGLQAKVKLLGSYSDQNFLLRDRLSGEKYVLKISNAADSADALEAQNEAMAKLSENGINCPQPRSSINEKRIESISSRSGQRYLARVLTHVPGTFLADGTRHSPQLLKNLGCYLGRLNCILADFRHSGTVRNLTWDLKNVSMLPRDLDNIKDPKKRSLVDYFILQFQTHVEPTLAGLRKSAIHGDANDNNILVDFGRHEVTGIIDFGDLVYSTTIFDVAIAATFTMLERSNPLAAAIHFVKGYHQANPLTADEVDSFFYLICARVCMSVTMSAKQKALEPANRHITLHEEKMWRLLQTLLSINPERARTFFRQACGPTSSPRVSSLGHKKVGELRKKHLNPALGLSYVTPLKITRGAMQYLFDEEGQTYLDCVNNVCHVGHCHPRVVRAIQKQIATLNTNTRYLHDTLVKYAGALTDRFPDPLNVCFFVNSGSEANDLALRLASAHTGGSDLIVISGAYHGNLHSLINISPYKFDGPGGAGSAHNVHQVEMPDTYRGKHKLQPAQAAIAYAREVQQALQRVELRRGKVAAFVAEPLLGCGGQIVLPPTYLQRAYDFAWEAGAVCIADEVQVGFGRVGSHFWGFETQDVVPDIVTLGKPIGNGHPLGAVVTTRAIAESFNNGMEYFNTFGGNPVSCAAGLAVLKVIAEEGLQKNAEEVGHYLKQRLNELKPEHNLIGDVRGLGLFLGVELVTDREALTPAATEAAAVVEAMKERGILLSTDGPLHNVIKIKPPIIFSRANADRLVEALDEVLAQHG